MIQVVHIALVLLCLAPVDSIQLSRECSRIHSYEAAIFCSPFTGNSIFRLDEQQDMQSITFTDDANYRIRDIALTPFAFYLNNGRAIEKFYLTSGVKETVFVSTDITSFIITSTEEIVLSDHKKRQIIFLDFIYTPRFVIHDVIARDMVYLNETIYILLQNSILVCDEHGNIIEEKTTSARADRIFAYDTSIILYYSGEKRLFVIDEEIQDFELAHGVRDIADHKDFIVILNQHGTTLFVYRKSDF